MTFTSNIKTDMCDNAWCFTCQRSSLISIDSKYIRCPKCHNQKLVIIENWAALEISILALRLYQGCLANAVFSDMTKFAVHNDPSIVQRAHLADIGHFGAVNYWVPYHLDLALNDRDVAALIDRVWFQGAFLTLGDRLADADYIDHQPELELVYHIRNAIAHGNRFSFSKGGAARLQKYPAHNDALPKQRRLEITLGLQDQEALFAFAKPDEFLSIINGVNMRLHELVVTNDPWKNVRMDTEDGMRIDERLSEVLSSQ